MVQHIFSLQMSHTQIFLVDACKAFCKLQHCGMTSEMYHFKVQVLETLQTCFLYSASPEGESRQGGPGVSLKNSSGLVMNMGWQ
jgi:hypothetical protein